MTAAAVGTYPASFSSTPFPSDGATEPVGMEPLLTFPLRRAEVVIRRLLHHDGPALEWHGGLDLRSFYEWQWSQHLAGDRCVLVADFNGFSIGQVAIHWQGKPTHPHVPDFQSLRVHPIFQGMGIGSRLLEVSEAMVAERGFNQASLAVGVQNLAARRLYERVGYRVAGEPYNDAWSYIDAAGRTVPVEETVVDMVKNLPRAENGAGE